MLKKSLGSVDLTKPTISMRGIGLLVLAVVVLFAAYEIGKYLYVKLKSGVSRIAPETSVADVLADFPM